MNQNHQASDTDLREQIYDHLKNHGLPVGFLYSPKHWQLFNDALDGVMVKIAADKAAVIKQVQRDTIWNIMSPKTEGLFDDGELFIKRQPIEQAIISMIGYEEYKWMQEAVDAQLKAGTAKG